VPTTDPASPAHATRPHLAHIAHLVPLFALIAFLAACTGGGSGRVDTGAAFHKPCSLISQQNMQAMAGPSLTGQDNPIGINPAENSPTAQGCQFGGLGQIPGHLLVERGAAVPVKFDALVKQATVVTSKGAPSNTYETASSDVFVKRKIGSDYYLITLSSPSNAGQRSANTHVLAVSLAEVLKNLGA
jgi:hypothetical protein